MQTNRELALRARDVLIERLGLQPAAPVPLVRVSAQSYNRLEQCHFAALLEEALRVQSG